MKKIIYFFAILTLVFTVISCGSDDGDDNNDLSCQEATEAASTAAEELANADSGTYEVKCVAYKQALENWKTACGDANGSIQAIIDGLGDCTDSVVTSEDCAICTISGIEGQYCDNGDGTITVIVAGQSVTQDLNGISFNAFLVALEQAGASCN